MQSWKPAGVGRPQAEVPDINKDTSWLVHGMLGSVCYTSQAGVASSQQCYIHHQILPSFKISWKSCNPAPSGLRNLLEPNRPSTMRIGCELPLSTLRCNTRYKFAYLQASCGRGLHLAGVQNISAVEPILQTKQANKSLDHGSICCA